MRQIHLTNRPAQIAGFVWLFSGLFCVCGTLSLFSTRDAPVLYWLIVAPSNLTVIAVIGMWLGLIALMILRIFRKFHVGMLVGTALFACAGTFSLFLGSSSHVDSATFNGHLFHLALNEDGKWSTYILCECDGSGNLCRCHPFYDRYMSERPLNNSLVVDAAHNELKVKAGDDIIYVVGASTRCYEIKGYCLEK